MIKELRCKLTKKELDVKHSELTRVLDEQDAAEAAFGQVKADHKRGLKLLGERVECLRRDLRSGTEDRPVDCEEKVDERRGIVEVVRLDTGETIDSRAMSMQERQTGLDFDEDQDEEGDEDPDSYENTPDDEEPVDG